MSRISVFLSIVALVSAAVSLRPQNPAKPSFDVISVKPNTSGGPPLRTGTWNNRFIAENVPLILLIQYAYRPAAGVRLRQHVIGGPDWINIDRFDIEAKLDKDIQAIPTEQTWAMVQALLEDRFQLKLHSEMRQLPVYDLVVAKGGAKLKLSADQTIPQYDDQLDEFDPTIGPPRGERSLEFTASGETIVTATAIPMVPSSSARRSHSLLPLGLTTILTPYVGRPVIDKTNLTGLFDFRFRFANPTPADNPDLPGASIFTAVQDQLGLKLEATRGPVEVLVIHSVQRPKPN
jgi:uncharacterized protein (TIGR03435 family)